MCGDHDANSICKYLKNSVREYAVSFLQKRRVWSLNQSCFWVSKRHKGITVFKLKSFFFLRNGSNAWVTGLNILFNPWHYNCQILTRTAIGTEFYSTYLQADNKLKKYYKVNILLVFPFIVTHLHISGKLNPASFRLTAHSFSSLLHFSNPSFNVARFF